MRVAAGDAPELTVAAYTPLPPSGSGQRRGTGLLRCARKDKVRGPWAFLETENETRNDASMPDAMGSWKGASGSHCNKQSRPNRRALRDVIYARRV